MNLPKISIAVIISLSLLAIPSVFAAEEKSVPRRALWRKS